VGHGVKIVGEFLKTRKRLLQFIALWLVLGSACALGAHRLVTRADRLDLVPVYFYDQPVWSSDEGQIAYFRLTGPYGSTHSEPDSFKREIWQVDRQGNAPKKVADLAPGRYRLAGWFDEDKQLLLFHGPGADPEIELLSVRDGKRQALPYQHEHFTLVGTGEGQLFFQRNEEHGTYNFPASELSASPSPSPAPSASPTASSATSLNRPQTTLFGWSPSQGYQRILNVPYENETLSIEQALPSPDRKRIAIVLKVGANDRALWLFDKDTRRLSWSGIKIPVDSMKLAWSPDSKGLIASAHSHKFCDLYVTRDVERAEFRKLRSASGPLASGVQPYWPRDQNYFLLLRGAEVFEFDAETRQARPLQLQSILDAQPRGLSISPRGTWAAYHFIHHGADELSCVSLSTRQPHLLVGASDNSKQRNQWWYLLGDGFRQASQYWRGTP
jgi:hypothetical protein